MTEVVSSDNIKSTDPDAYLALASETQGSKKGKKKKARKISARKAAQPTIDPEEL